MDIESKMTDLCKMEEHLIETLKCEFSKGAQCVDTDEAGKVVNMIKDLAEAKKDCYKALYYKSIVAAMLESEDAYGYNPNRYSSGRYAPAGRGRKRYEVAPYVDHPYDMGDTDLSEILRMGYNAGGRSGIKMHDLAGSSNLYDGNTHMTGKHPEHSWDDRYGKAYNEYKDSRRYYTETKSPAHKQEMESHATEHIMDTISTVREIYKNSEPELRRKIKDDMAKLVSEMSV